MTPEPAQRYTFDRVVRLIISLVLLAVVFGLLRLLSAVLIPFVAAIVLAYLLNPLVNAFEAKLKRRGWAVLLTLVTVGTVGLAVVVALIPLTVFQVQRFGADLQQLREDLAAGAAVDLAAVRVVDPPAAGHNQAPSNRAAGAQTPAIRPEADQADAGQLADREAETSEPPKTRLGWHELVAGWREFRTAGPEVSREQRFQRLRASVEGTYIGMLGARVAGFMQSDEFDAWAMSLAKQVASGGWTVITFAVNLVLGLTVLIIVLLYLVFLLLDYPEYARTWDGFIPPRYREQTLAFLGDFEAVLRRYLRGQAVVALLMGVLFSIGFSLIGLPMAVPLGLFIGLLNMVPYLQTVGLVPALLLALMRSVETGSSLIMSIVLTLAVFAVAQLIQDALIVPRVMGKATGLRPVAVLLGVFIWGKLLGFLGLLLAIPLTCVAIAYYRRLVLNQSVEETSLTAEPEQE